jgi:hypothetical protein
VFENREPRMSFMPRRDAGTAGWRKQHSENFHNLYSSRMIIVRMVHGLSSYGKEEKFIRNFNRKKLVDIEKITSKNVLKEQKESYSSRSGKDFLKHGSKIWVLVKGIGIIY